MFENLDGERQELTLWCEVLHDISTQSLPLEFNHPVFQTTPPHSDREGPNVGEGPSTLTHDRPRAVVILNSEDTARPWWKTIQRMT
jgi:hypothetical protein